MKRNKILICDDDTAILEVVKIILEEHGYKALILSSGKGIQKRIGDFSPDLILLDLMMPGIEGKEITKLLKRDIKLRSIPIIVMSALNDGPQIATQVGADGFLNKPFDINDLVRLVQKYTGEVPLA